MRKSLPHYPLPAFLVTQLAVDQAVAGQGFGGITLVNAIRFLCAVHESLPAVAIIVDCLGKDAEQFYTHYGFESLCKVQGRQRLFLPMKTASAV